MGAITVQEQPEVTLTTEAVEESLDQQIEAPDECICDYVTTMPYNLSQRIINPACRADHTGGDELERDR